MKNKPRDIPYYGVRRDKIASLPIESINAEALDMFLYFIDERYKIHLRKDIQLIDPPYTRDAILQYYRFTNIRREYDRNTKWAVEHICNNQKLRYGQKLVNLVLFRIFNKIKTAELLQLPILDPKKLDVHSTAEQLELLLDDTPFTGAYLCSGMKRYMKKYTETDSNTEAALKIVQEMCEDKFWKGTKKATSPAVVLGALQQYPGISEFMSYQIFVDFTYIDDFPFSENEYTIAGIGAKNGLKLLFQGNKRVRNFTPEELIFWLRDNWEELNQYNTQHGGKHTVKPKILFQDLPEYDRVMNVMSIENCLCEFSKYYKAKNGLGRPRQKYRRTK